MNLRDEHWDGMSWPLEKATFCALLKCVPEDFRVDEVPAYTPCGHGEFVYVHLEKRDVSSDFFIRTIAERLDLKSAAIGVAGRKDRRAVTSQWVSIAAADLKKDVSAIEGPVGQAGHIRLLKSSRHTNKLRTGHLKGNRFAIRLRPRGGHAMPTVAQLRDRLAWASARGFPNLFGAQRFSNGKTVSLGLAALEGQRISSVRRLKLGISAVQSLVFNRWLALRLEAGHLDQALDGDILKKRATGGVFICDDPAKDTARIQAGELVVTGPLPGNKLMAAQGTAAEFEHRALASLGLGQWPFKPLGKRAPGTRRPALMFPADSDVQSVGAPDAEACVEVRFFLPKGSYATVLLEAVAGAVEGDE